VGGEVGLSVLFLVIFFFSGLYSFFFYFLFLFFLRDLL